MTQSEIYERLKQTPQNELLKVKNILEEHDITQKIAWLKSIDKNNPQPLDYLVNAVLEHDYGNYRSGRPCVDLLDLYSHSLFRSVSKIRYSTFIEDLPVEIHPYLPKNIASRLKTIQRNKQVKEATKALQLNEFSYLAFKAALTTGKKKPSGVEAIAQIRKLPTLRYYTKEENEIYDKFLALYWNAIPKKSMPFCNEVFTKTRNTEYSPIFRITHSVPWSSPREAVFDALFKRPVTSDKSVVIDFYFYQKVAREYHIPVLQELYTQRYSEHHIYYSGIPKQTKLTTSQVEMVVSQILVLDYIINHIQPKELNFPYFQIMKDFLVQEIKNQECDVKKLLKDVEIGHTAAITTYKNLQKELA